MTFELSRSTTAADMLSTANFTPALDKTSLTTSLPGLQQASQSLLFIDGSLTDYQQLVAGITLGTEVHILNSSQDAVTQITDALLGRSNISSLHIVSHGEAGGLDFGSSRLNVHDLPEYAAQLQSWGKALTDDADLLLYGCDVAQSELGKTFTSILSQLTGADVAASTNSTGSSAQGSDWNLEVSTGKIESVSPFSSEATQAYNQVLGINVAIMSDISGGTGDGFAAIRNQLNNDTYYDFTATLVSSSQIDTLAELNAYNAVVIGDNGLGNPGINSAFATALKNWVEAGGALVATGFTIYGANNNTDIDAVVPVNTVGGAVTVSTGGSIVPNGTVHPVTTGINSFAFNGLYEYATAGIDSGATTLATINSQAGVVISSKGLGKSVYLSPVYAQDSSTGNVDLRSGNADRLLEQAVAWASGLSTPPSAAPSVTLSNTAASYTENALPTELDTSATVADTDSTNFNTGTLTVNFSTNGTASDRLVINTGGQIGISGSNVTFGGTQIGTFTGGVGTTPLVITFNSSSSPAAAQALLRNVAYSNASDAPTTTARTVSIVLTDGAGGTSTTATKTINITAVNDAPSLTGNATLAGIASNAANPNGNTLTSLFSSLFSDLDASASLSGLAIVGNTANATTQGRWQYSLTGTTWSDIGTVAEGATALALSASTRVRFVPVANYAGAPPSLSVRALDNTYSGGFTTTTPVLVNTTTNGGSTAIAATATTLSTSVTARVPNLLWRNSVSGENVDWQLNNYSVQSSYFLPAITEAGWQIAASNADFNQDGFVDILWRNQNTGLNVIWELNSTGFQAGYFIEPIADTNWQIAGTADFNRDGITDIVWRNQASGENVVWQQNGATLVTRYFLPSVVEAGWQIVSTTGDFNRDGIGDLLWRNQTTGANVIWQMNSTGLRETGYFIQSLADANWQIAGTGDLDRDGVADIVWRNRTSGENAIWKVTGTSVQSVFFTQVADTNWQIAGVADLGGNSTPELLWQNKAAGQEVIWQMNGFSYAQGYELPDVRDANWSVRPFVSASIPAPTVTPA